MPVIKSIQSKHKRLVLQCYPKGRSQEKKPNPSELSYLLFYLASRRSKLQKVAAFLQQKTQRDVYRGRAGNVEVSLAICKAVIERCHSDLNAFAEHVVALLIAVIESTDITLCQKSLDTFATFCKYHDGGLLSDDESFVDQYKRLLKDYMNVANRQDVNSLQWRLIALEAALSVAPSPALSTPSGRVQIHIIIPVILQNLRYKEGMSAATSDFWNRALDNDTQQLHHGRNASRDSASSEVQRDSDISEEDQISLVALRALRALFVTSNVFQIHHCTEGIVKFLITHDHSAKWSLMLFKTVVNWTPLQLRYMILRDLLEALSKMPPESIREQNVLIGLISSLLTSDISLVGTSVIDEMHLLITRALKLLSAQESWALSDESRSAHLRDLFDKIIDCIADLAYHSYYSDQISDMLTDLLYRLRSPNAPSDMGEDVDCTVGRNGNSIDSANLFANSSFLEGPKRMQQAICGNLRAVRKIISIAASVHRGLKRSYLRFSAFRGTQWILSSGDPLLYRPYLSTIFVYFELEFAKQECLYALAHEHFVDKVNRNPTILRSGDLADFFSAANDLLLRHSCTESDYMALNLLFNYLGVKLEVNACLRGVLFIMEAESSTKYKNLAYNNKHRAYSVMMNVLLLVAQTLELKDLQLYITTLISDLKTATLWDENITNPPNPKPYAITRDGLEPLPVSMEHSGDSSSNNFPTLDREEIIRRFEVPGLLQSVKEYIILGKISTDDNGGDGGEFGINGDGSGHMTPSRGRHYANSIRGALSSADHQASMSRGSSFVTIPNPTASGSTEALPRPFFNGNGSPSVDLRLSMDGSMTGSLRGTAILNRPSLTQVSPDGTFSFKQAAILPVPDANDLKRIVSNGALSNNKNKDNRNRNGNGNRADSMRSAVSSFRNADALMGSFGSIGGMSSQDKLTSLERAADHLAGKKENNIDQDDTSEDAMLERELSGQSYVSSRHRRLEKLFDGLHV